MYACLGHTTYKERRTIFFLVPLLRETAVPILYHNQHGRQWIRCFSEARVNQEVFDKSRFRDMDAAKLESVSGDHTSDQFCPTLIKRELKFSDGDHRLIERRCAKWKLPPTHFTPFTIDTIFLVPAVWEDCVNDYRWTVDYLVQPEVARYCEKVGHWHEICGCNESGMRVVMADCA